METDVIIWKWSVGGRGELCSPRGGREARERGYSPFSQTLLFAGVNQCKCMAQVLQSEPNWTPAFQKNLGCLTAKVLLALHVRFKLISISGHCSWCLSSTTSRWPFPVPHSSRQSRHTQHLLPSPPIPISMHSYMFYQLPLSLRHNFPGVNSPAMLCFQSTKCVSSNYRPWPLSCSANITWSNSSDWLRLMCCYGYEIGTLKKVQPICFLQILQ